MMIMGFDFGMKHIGVAIGQSITGSATPLTALLAKDGIPHWDDIQSLIDEWHPEAIVVGIPLNMDGTEQPLTLAAKRFANRLKARFKLPVHPVDERLSSWEALDRLQKRKNIKKNTRQLNTITNKTKNDIKLLNATAAAILVEQWLSENS